MTLPRRRLMIVSAIVLVIVAAVFYVIFFGQPTYVRIVDASSIPTDTSPAPGADINAIAIIKGSNKKTTYASEVAASHITDGADGTQNTAKDASNILGAESDDQETKYVSLGIGGEIVVKLNATLGNTDQLVVYEIGTESGPKAEYYKVSISHSANGPWTELGTEAVAGPHTFEFGGDSPFRK